MSELVPDAAGDYLCALLGKEFTAEQLAIVTAPLGPQLVIAGAGSGKTMVMAARVVHAVAFLGVAPAQILGLTFTNKAAGELAERVRVSLAELRRHRPVDPRDDTIDDELPTIATYNSYAATIVRDHALRIGREPNATLLTEAVQWQLAMRVATRATGPFEHLNWTTATVADYIVSLAGDLSDHLATAEDVRRHDEVVRADVLGIGKPLKARDEMVEKGLARAELLELIAAYTAEKQRLEVIDYGDQVALATRIALTAAEVAATERDRFALVVLDEYQDTGVAQRRLLTTLFGQAHAVTAVGDPNQAIYGWRGASASNLSRFGEHFAAGLPAPPTRTLMTTFRCAGRVLEAANVVSAPLLASLEAKGRATIEFPPLQPTAAAVDAGEVVVTRLETALDEAEWLATKVSAAIEDGHEPRQIAILSRRRTDFARLHQAMVERDIPVEVVGLGGLLAMPEVSDIVAVLTVLSDATANAAALRLLSGPRWRLGVRDLAALGSRANELVRDRLAGAGDGSAGAVGGDGGHGDGDRGDGDVPAVSDSGSGDSADSGDAVESGDFGDLDKALQAATSSVDPVEVPSLLEAAESPGRHSRCSPEALARLAKFVAEIRWLRGLAGQPLVDLITEVIATTGLDVEIEAGDAALAEARLANVHAFLDVAAQFSGLDGDGDLAAFLAYLRAASDNEDGLDIGAVSDANTVKLMTIHAAKGLEWDIVAVPGLALEIFPVTKSRSTWLSGAQVLPFSCRGDAADLPMLTGYESSEINAFKDECRSDSHDEERRLAYVAMTRARHALWLSSYVWSPTRQKPLAPSPYLEEVAAIGAPTITVESWAPDPEAGTTSPLLAAGIADVAWPAAIDAEQLALQRDGVERVAKARAAADRDDLVSDGAGGENATGEDMALWRRDVELLLDEIRRRRGRVVEVAVPARLTTSQIVELARDPDRFAASLARPVPTAPVTQARRGSRFHRWVEELYGASSLIEPDDLPGAEDGDLADDELAALQDKFLADGWGERRPIAVEAPFEMVVGGRLVRGRIDAVYRYDEGTLYETYDVIDFKTGTVPTGAEFAAASLQLSIYRQAWADLAGVDLAAVQAGFLYVRTGELKRPDTLLDRDELAELLAG